MERGGRLYRRILVQAGLLSERQGDLALQKARAEGADFVEWVLNLELVKAEDAVRAIAEHCRVEVAHIDPDNIDSRARELIPRDLCEYHEVVPLRLEDEVLTLATADPANIRNRDDLKLVTGCTVEFAVATTQAIRHAIDHAYVGCSD
ncbi:hypothetical protein ACFL59_00625 [Planctomycetota bacterium]